MINPPSPSGAVPADTARLRFQEERVAYWDATARRMAARPARGVGHRHRLAEVYRFLIPPGRRVLEVGCAQGDLLAALEPSIGVGVDGSGVMVEMAARKYPALRFIRADAQSFEVDGAFGFVILSYLVDDLWDVSDTLRRVAQVMAPRGRLILEFPPSSGPPSATPRGAWTGPGRPGPGSAAGTSGGCSSLPISRSSRPGTSSCCPTGSPLLSALANRYLVKLWPLGILAQSHLIVARLIRPSADRPRSPGGAIGRGDGPLEETGPVRSSDPARPRVSLVIPARNEAGNIPQIFALVPEMGSGTELIFVEGGSRDDTYTVSNGPSPTIPSGVASSSGRPGRARETPSAPGSKRPRGVLMILDADLTVAPADLPKFLDVLLRGRADLVNGSRLVYPMEDRAMQLLNSLANRCFGWAFSWLLGQPVKDTLCGTKALWGCDYRAIAANRAYFGDFDPFGDFDLLFGAAKLNLRIRDLPVRYRSRAYGTTNIQRWRHGWLPLRMLVFATRRLKFV
jgi:SAM-dependent methyltransferase